MPKRSRRNTKRLKASAHPSCRSTTAVAAVVALAVPTKTRKRLTMSSEPHRATCVCYECLSELQTHFESQPMSNYYYAMRFLNRRTAYQKLRDCGTFGLLPE